MWGAVGGALVLSSVYARRILMARHRHGLRRSGHMVHVPGVLLIGTLSASICFYIGVRNMARILGRRLKDRIKLRREIQKRRTAARRRRQTLRRRLR